MSQPNQNANELSPDAPDDEDVEISIVIRGDVEKDPLRMIRGISHASSSLSERLRDAVSSARAVGLSWDLIGGALGVSRQAAWERFATGTDAEDAPRVES